MRIDINCDMGEGFGAYTIGDDAAVIRSVTSANIACGFHAGDPLIMDRTVRLAAEHGVGVGAHPGFPDLPGFGRRRMDTAPGEVTRYLLYQMGALWAMCRAAGVAMRHVKPHGALYNMAADDECLAGEVVAAITSFDRDLVLVTLPDSILARVARSEGLRVAREVFPDRAYTDDGRLAPRSLPGAVIHDPDAVRDRVIRLVAEGRITSITGKEISLAADTLCVHGDTPGAAALAALIRRELKAAGVEVKPLAR